MNAKHSNLIQEFSVEKLQTLWDLKKKATFGFKNPITPIEVDRAIFEHKLLKPKKVWSLTRNKHIQYLAYLVSHGWSEPIFLDFYNKDDLIPIGEHEFYSAILRGNKKIKAVAFGLPKDIEKYLAE